MYWWNTKKLAEDIKSGEFSEQQRKSYYIGTTILGLLAVYIITAAPAADPVATLIEAASVIAISILGINITFKTNRGNEGRDFIGRSLVLSFPLIIKILIFGIFYGFAIEIAIEILQSESFNTWAMLPFGILIQIWYFWRLNVHLKALNT